MSKPLRPAFALLFLCLTTSMSIALPHSAE
jgi:hypothetical protein